MDQSRWARAVEAKLAGDNKTLLSIALDPECPEDLLQRLGLGGEPSVTAATLLQPHAPIAVIEEAAASGKLPFEILAALHPRAPESLLEALAGLGKVSVWFALFLNPSTPPSLAASLGGDHARLAAIRKIYRLAQEGGDWKSLAQAHDTVLGERWQSCIGGSNAFLDPEVPHELLAAHLAKSPMQLPFLVAKRWRYSPDGDSKAVREDIDGLLSHVDLAKFMWTELGTLLNVPDLPLSWLQKVLERLVRARPSRPVSDAAIRRGGSGTAAADRWNSSRLGVGKHATLLARAGKHPAWTEASLDDLEESAARHPRLFLGFLENKALSDETKATLLAWARSSPKVLERWRVGRTLERPKGPERAPRPFIELPIPLLCGIASRPDLTSKQVDRLRRLDRPSITVHLAAGGHIEPDDIRRLVQTLENKSGTSGSDWNVLARAPNLPLDLLQCAPLIQHAGERLAKNPSVDPEALLDAYAIHATWHSLPDALVAHPKLTVKSAKRLLKKNDDLLDRLLAQANLPHAWRLAQCNDQVSRLILPEADPAVIDAYLAHCNASVATRLLRNPCLRSDQVSRLARLGISAASADPEKAFRL
ncbi:MAG: hypothetical protein WCI05_18660, partial [Myxococcales bacterium]